MIVSYSGDEFLARRAARAYLRDQGLGVGDVTELSEDMSGEQIAQLAAQTGLFGRVALFLDFDAAFTGQAGVKPRNEAMRALESVSEDTVVVVVDSSATNARQKAFRALGTHHHLPTPKYGALTRWVAEELEHKGVRSDRDVPGVLADLFGEDLPAIVAEIEKLAVLDETLSAERVREIANRPAARNAFDLIDAAVAGDAPKALAVCRTLLEQGEAPPRVMGALAWQFDLVARSVGLQQESGRIADGEAAKRLKANPYAAKKAFGVARGLDESDLYEALSTLLAADVDMKSGRDPAATMELCTVALAGVFDRAS